MTNELFTSAENRSGAFAPDGQFLLAGAARGPLARLRVGVKDLFDIAGRRTGAGNPDWLASHPLAQRNAVVVDELLAAGADVIGKTLCDELGYSMTGENHHYGTPVNPVSPERVPGGSSSGSAVATAAGLCDIGLGSDTASSIRLPAAFCGLWGFRPSHGAVSREGAVPLAPSFDTPGWMARDANVLERVGEVLLPRCVEKAALPSRLLIADDAWAMANTDVRTALDAKLPAVMAHFASVSHDVLADEGLLAWQLVFRLVQGREVWATHGEWIKARAPRFGPGVHERFQWAATISADAAASAAQARERLTALLEEKLAGAVLCIPTVSFVAPVKGAPTVEEDRTRALCLLAIASLARLPQVTIPIAQSGGCAVGLSLLGARGSDRALLAQGVELAASGRLVLPG